jgi:parvulin-like peptidyl-prolyl isomerase
MPEMFTREKIVVTIVFIFSLASTYCQTFDERVDQIKKEFENSENDSITVSKYSSIPYEKEIFSRDSEADNHLKGADSLVFFSDKGVVLEFNFPNENKYILAKIVDVKYAIPYSFGQIFIDTSRIEAKEALLTAKKLEKRIATEGFEVVCSSINETDSIIPQCKFDYSYNQYFISEFNRELLKIKKGKTQIIKTEFGYHVVKVFEKGQKSRSETVVCFIVLKK